MSLTRRQALELGSAALAVAVLRPAAALSAEPALFEMALGGGRAAAAGWRTTPVLRAPRRFDLIGLRWRGEATLRAEVRARRRGGQWSRWAELPHPHDPLPGTDPAWTGAADFFQLRLLGSADGLTARFVRVGRRRARLAARAAQAGAPPIITREQWGGDEVPPRSEPSYGEVQLAFVHHTVTTNDYAPEDSAGIVKGIAKYHRDTNGWNDLGYNFLIDKYGQIFEGRAGGVQLAVIGAQAEGYNRLSTGVACLGTLSEVAQAEAGMEALARLLGWKLSLHGVPCQGQVTVTSGGGSSNRHANGKAVTFERIAGHRDGNHTACPGDAMYAQLADLRTRAAAHAGSLSALTLSPAEVSVKAGRALAVSGVLRFGDGSPPGGLPVRVDFRAAGTQAWEPLETFYAAGDGRWSGSVDLPVSGELRAVFAGDATRPPLESPPVEVAIEGRIRMSVTPRRVRRRGVVEISGTIEPKPPGLRVEIRTERQVGSRWRLVQTKKVRVRAGTFKTRVKLRFRGPHRVWVVAPGATRSARVRVL